MASTSKVELAAEVWQRLFDFIIATRARRETLLSKYDLTPNDSRALFTLDTVGKTMQSLAKAWSCDPSNTTWVIDRLERHGLAQRRGLPGDRRVKLVVLTPRGEKVREALREGFYRPPPELLGLEVSELKALLSATERLGSGTEP